MAQEIDLKELERKAFKSTFQDGLWDIFLGLLLLAMAAFAWLSDTNLPPWTQWLLFITMEVLAIVVLWVGKKYITVPRMGRVKLGPAGQARQKKTRWLLAVSVITGALLFIVSIVIGTSQPDWLQPGLIFPAVWVANMLIVFGLIAYFCRFNRLYVIGFLYAICLPLDIALKKMAEVYFPTLALGAPAVIILTIGIVVFIRFLREYPLPEKEV